MCFKRMAVGHLEKAWRNKEVFTWGCKELSIGIRRASPRKDIPQLGTTTKMAFSLFATAPGTWTASDYLPLLHRPCLPSPLDLHNAFLLPLQIMWFVCLALRPSLQKHVKKRYFSSVYAFSQKQVLRIWVHRIHSVWHVVKLSVITNTNSDNTKQWSGCSAINTIILCMPSQPPPNPCKALTQWAQRHAGKRKMAGGISDHPEGKGNMVENSSMVENSL